MEPKNVVPERGDPREVAGITYLLKDMFTRVLTQLPRALAEGDGGTAFAVIDVPLGDDLRFTAELKLQVLL